MISKDQYEQMRKKTVALLENNRIALTDQEKSTVEVADFGLDDIENTGLQVITYINTQRVCAKELVLLPHQTCPEHRHPTINNVLGKEETFRCRAGIVYLYVPGEAAANPHCLPPEGSSDYYTVWHEVVLRPGEQYTLHPDTLHWFQAGDEGAIVSEFSTMSTDDADIFTDPRIVRTPEIK